MDVRYAISRMTLADLPRVLQIENLAYPTSQWPESAYHRELRDNRWAHYIVVRDTQLLSPEHGQTPESPITRRAFPFSLFQVGRNALNEPATAAIVGYAGLWLMVDEAHITTIATHPSVRGRGVGELLLVHLIDIAYSIGARWVTLEVRVSNTVAQSLYRKYGFHIISTRPRYYSDNNEDAYIMWTEEILTPQYRTLFGTLKAHLLERLKNAQTSANQG